MVNPSRTDSLGIYIQVPFCQTKCTYCNFHTGVAARSLYAPVCARGRARNRRACGLVFAQRVWSMRCSAAQSAAVSTRSTWAAERPACSIPPILRGSSDAVRAHFPVRLREVTLEADPETIRRDNAAAWKSAGINRISLGAQSFQDTELAAAGRMHRRDDIGRAIDVPAGRGICKRQPGSDCRPAAPDGAKLARVRSSSCCGCGPSTCSIYLLEIDEGSRLGSEALAGGSRYGAAAIPDDDVMAACYELACAELAAAGYEHYEISNWALPGYGSRHNLKYWRREPYFGFGAGAHSFDGHYRAGPTRTMPRLCGGYRGGAPASRAAAAR